MPLGRTEEGRAPRKALVREPGDHYSRCISCHPLRDTIDLGRARDQHRAYCRALSELGLEVIPLPRDNAHPDSCFVEDNAVVHSRRALICRMARDARRGEEDSVEAVLREYMDVRRAVSPATVEGGDVIHMPNRLISGLSQRTNSAGIEQMRDWLRVKIDVIQDEGIVHLKSYVTYLGRGTVIASRRFSEHPALEGCDLILLSDSEAYAADTLAVAGTVLMPAGRERARDLVREAGFDVVTLDTGEFEKCEGALTCLSIIF